MRVLASAESLAVYCLSEPGANRPSAQGQGFEAAMTGRDGGCINGEALR
jgi:hypothetical protein